MNWKSFWAIVCFCAAAVIASPAQTFTSLFQFDGTDGGVPQGALVQGFNGNIYGTSSQGDSANNFGTVFEMTPGGTLTTLYTFTGGTDGGGPVGGLTQATNGNLYGTTYQGGVVKNSCAVEGCGTVFRITPSGALTTLHRFGGTDGFGPYAPLAAGIDGNFYGSTAHGGFTQCSPPPRLGCGTIYKITPTGQFTTLHIFCQQTGCPDGSSPEGALVQASNGSFYGVAASGGSITSSCKGCGTVFQVTTTGTFKVLHAFQGTDGSFPIALTMGSDGNLYGATYQGGAATFGVLFKLSLSGTFTKLYDFTTNDGTYTTGLTQANDGNFYGPLEFYGANNHGSIFELTPSGTFTGLYAFTGDAGLDPQSPLLQETSGTFFGTTLRGGINNCSGECGTIYSFNTGLGPFVTFVMKAGKVGGTAEILGQGFTGTTSVSFNGVPATFSVHSDTLLLAKVPSGATTGSVTVTTPGGTLTSNVAFQVIP